MQPVDEKNEVSRRDALKVLAAAAGAATLSTLPSQWEKPVIEVGVLPVHAQGSPATVVTISNLAITFTGLNDCTILGLTGSSNDLSFDYDDPSGRVTSGSVVRFGTDFDTNLPSNIDINDPIVDVSGNTSSGTITLTPLCAAFGNSSSLTVEVQLVNSDGVASNRLQITVPRPPGAQGAGAKGSIGRS
jgi:hypothetical protein